MRCLALVSLLLATAFCAAAQPARLAVPPPDAGYTDDLHPIGWSATGERIAFLYRWSGGGATGSRYVLRIQDLTTDRLVADEMLTSTEPDGEPRLATVWSAQQRRIQSLLRQHGVRPSAVRMSGFPLAGSGGPYSASITTEERDGQTRAYTVTLRNGRGRAKTLGSETFGTYSTPTSVRALGALRAPTGERLAVVVEVAEPGYEAEGARRYRLYGARIGARF